MTEFEPRNSNFEIRAREKGVYACSSDVSRIKCANGIGACITLTDTPDDPAFKRGFHDSK